MPSPTEAGLSGRRQQAALNDEAILTAAREVFLQDPRSPIADVAKHAGVGISALYRRYPSKEELLRKLCHDGLRRYIAEAEAALAEPDAWAAFTAFLVGVVDADVHSLTVHLAGTFTPTPEMGQDAQRAGQLAEALVERAHAAGKLRADVVAQDLGLVLEGCAAIRMPDAGRTAELRRRVLAMMVDSLARTGGPDLPGPPPAPGEFSWRWRPRP
ncbi:helix-turn-helix domain-containing protein [Actinosynnema sp. NPDC047251]|uniref:Transcriptional regulator, TetR family n=1 Tax=Saccharothrix espanaensis (strain ATCC 51144 / DSM 44229 / JCM 9112 / NBRC 15066 / NRRL 15764) TaxID=1179773 RepID=K0JVW4_SACES|nr:TetR/AcrR family transcriptional regulator [Saccharothrix espanaensis]CCH30121.1 Transcriptional regulator, TetR family [Saccharothrix espanaensis DSM 44229]